MSFSRSKKASQCLLLENPVAQSESMENEASELQAIAFIDDQVSAAATRSPSEHHLWLHDGKLTKFKHPLIQYQSALAENNEELNGESWIVCISES